jgi:hypothetical protein
MKVFNKPVYWGNDTLRIDYDLGDGSADCFYVTSPFTHNGEWCVNRHGVLSHSVVTLSFGSKDAALCYRDLYDNWDRLCARTKATEFTMTEMTHMQIFGGLEL